MKSKSYQDLDVWKLSMELAVEVYKVIQDLPSEERFALADQVRRCAVSIPSNIAEGQRRYSKKEFIRFASIALGSVGELETQLILCRRLHGLAVEKQLEKCAIISRMLLALIKSQRTGIESA